MDAAVAGDEFHPALGESFERFGLGWIDDVLDNTSDHGRPRVIPDPPVFNGVARCRRSAGEGAGCGAQNTAEMPGEMRLIMESRHGGRAPPEQRPPGADPPCGR